MSGPPPQPTVLKSRRGNPVQRPLNRREPKPLSYVGTVPAWLDEIGRNWWLEYAPKLTRAGTLDELSVEHLNLAAALYSTIRQTTVLLEQHGPMHPAHNVRSKALGDFRAHTAELGFGPGSRSRIVVSPPEAPSQWLGLVKV